MQTLFFFPSWHNLSPLCFPNLVTCIKICTTGQVWYARHPSRSVVFLSKWTYGDLRKTQIRLHELCTLEVCDYLKKHGLLKKKKVNYYNNMLFSLKELMPNY